MSQKLLLSFAILAALSVPVSAADECGAPPEAPDLPNVATASADDAQDLEQADQDFAHDTEGHLICLQLAASDIDAAVERGELTAGAAQTQKAALENVAAQVRGNQSGWRDKYVQWVATWTHAHR